MTRQEAAQICQSVKFILENSDYTEAVEEALNMAIEALEQEPTAEYSSDIISRQAAIDAIMGQPPEAHYPSWYAEQIKGLPTAQPFTEEQIQTMQELESAQVEKAFELGKADRTTGYWHIDAGVGCFCSKCGFDIGNDFDFMEYVRFCPYCGADMREANKK